MVNIAHRRRFALNYPLSLTHLKANLAARTMVSVCLRRDHMSNSSQKVPVRIVDLSEQSGWLFVRKLFLIVGVAASALALWRLSDVLLLAFGSILLALVLRGLAGIISGRTKISESLAVAAVVIAMTSAFTASAWLFGSQIATQFELLSENLPQGFAQIVRDLRATQWGAWIFLRAQEVNLTSATSQVTGYVTAVFGSIVRTTGYLAVFCLPRSILQRSRTGIFKVSCDWRRFWWLPTRGSVRVLPDPAIASKRDSWKRYATHGSSTEHGRS